MLQNLATSSVTLDDYHWLVGPQGQDWLQSIGSMNQARGTDLLLQTERLRRDLPAGRVHLLLSQVELRHRAQEKFPAAERMFFTAKGLEQATDTWVAAYKANRFPAGQPLADLCCGIGGDMLAMACRGAVRAVERDLISASLAEANVRSLGSACDGKSYPVAVETIDVADIAAAEFDNVAAWHIDPDRRSTGRRTTRVDLHEPGANILARLLAACPNAAIKLAPAATFDEPWWAEAELEWIGRVRQCRQLVAWFGSLAEYPSRRRATVIRSSMPKSETENFNDVPQLTTFIGKSDVETPITAQIGRYVFEPDPAVLAAKLEGALAVDQGLTAITGGAAYLTGDIPSKHAALACFEVLDVMPYRATAVRRWLAERRIGRLEVKKRGVPLDPERVRQELKTTGDEKATILLARIGGRVTAIMARRIGESR